MFSSIILKSSNLESHLPLNIDPERYSKRMINLINQFRKEIENKWDPKECYIDGSSIVFHMPHDGHIYQLLLLWQENLKAHFNV